MQAQSRFNQAALPQQPEETHWQDAFQTYLSDHPGARAVDIARALGCTEAEALRALSDSAWEMPVADLSKILAELGAWEKVLVLVRNGDAVAEVQVPGEGWYVNGDWLNWIDEGYNLHIRIAATHQILALVRSGKRGLTYSFNLVNQEGQVFCRFYARTPAAKERFLAFCQAAYAHRKGEA
jgi:putative heme degradation protein